MALPIVSPRRGVFRIEKRTLALTSYDFRQLRTGFHYESAQSLNFIDTSLLDGFLIAFDRFKPKYERIVHRNCPCVQFYSGCSEFACIFQNLHPIHARFAERLSYLLARVIWSQDIAGDAIFIRRVTHPLISILFWPRSSVQAESNMV